VVVGAGIGRDFPPSSGVSSVVVGIGSTVLRELWGQG
jgi:hypothetical protein